MPHNRREEVMALGIARSVVVAQGKGGVGKTSIVANVGGLAAAAGLRTLLVDLDPQGNLSRDLGMIPGTGSELLAALMSARPLPVQRGVRERLDVVAGGPELADLLGVMYSRSTRGAAPLSENLRSSLEAVASDYDLVLIDTPPGDRALVEAAMAVAAGVLVPTRADDASLDGLERVAERFAAARQINPDLQLVGVLLFAVGARSRRLETRVRRAIAAIVGDAPMLEARVRHLESAAVDARASGLLVHELEGAALKDRQARLAALRAGSAPQDGLLVRNAQGLADDYEAVAREVLTRMAAIEQEVSVG